MPPARCRTLSPVAIALVTLAGGCTTVAYPGPRRPRAEVATIDARDVAIDSVDGFDLHGESGRFEVPAGPRNLVVHLAWKRTIPRSVSGPGSSLSISVGRHSGPMGICFTAVAGHTYIIEPQTESIPWVNYVVVPQTSGVVWAPFVADGASDKPAISCVPVSDPYAPAAWGPPQ